MHLAVHLEMADSVRSLLAAGADPCLKVGTIEPLVADIYIYIYIYIYIIHVCVHLYVLYLYIYIFIYIYIYIYNSFFIFIVYL